MSLILLWALPMSILLCAPLASPATVMMIKMTIMLMMMVVNEKAPIFQYLGFTLTTKHYITMGSIKKKKKSI